MPFNWLMLVVPEGLNAMAKILIVTTRTPFILGGAEYHCEQLQLALEAAGHQVDSLAYPFNYTNPGQIVRTMYECETADLIHFDAGTADRVICLKFPTYYINHPNKIVWLLHQHRPAYDRWIVDQTATYFSEWMKNKIWELDTKHLGGLGTRLFTNSSNVSDRLARYLGIASTPLLHPPPILPLIKHASAERFIFYPSRLERLKRQSLLIDAMKLVKSDVSAVIAGSGGMHRELERQIETLNLGDRVNLVGPISTDALVDRYARCLGVFFGPLDEDYGYVTLEAMLAKKPVITCTDSGGPLTFVEDGRNGFVVQPSPESVADAIDRLAADPATSYQMGQEGFCKYLELNITWDHVIHSLISAK